MIAVFFLLIVLTGIFYGFSAAVANSNGSELEKNALSGDLKALLTYRLYREPFRYLNAIPMLVISCGASFGTVLSSWVSRGAHRFVILIPISVVCLLLTSALGILLFRRIGACHSTAFIRRFAGLVWCCCLVMYPFTYLITLMARTAAIPFGVRFDWIHNDVTEEEIISMVDEAHEQGVIEKNEARMIQNIISFNETQAHDIMTHRKKIAAFDENTLLQEMCDSMLEEGFSRYPVYVDSIDNIVGFVHFKDALKFLTKNSWARFKPLRELSGLIRKATLVPETSSISDLFHLMQARQTHIAVVVDEYGQTAGIISMEDILEEIVGDIMDEYDEEEERFRRQGPDVVTINAMTHLSEIEEELGITFGTTDFETLNGFLTSRLGHIPNHDDLEKEIEAFGYRFKILSLGNRTIGNVRAIRLNISKEDTDDELHSDGESSEGSKRPAGSQPM